MMKIQTMSDIYALKQQEHVPKQYVDELEYQFLAWQKELNVEDVLDEFGLPSEVCMYHVGRKEDMKILLSQIHEIEYVEIENIGKSTFFRIGLMQDHQMSLIFVLADLLPEDIKEWLHELGGR